ncbi:hypothetical protein SEUCBS139899_008586 [Sporothrix eucalyptigena]|uniref:Major facilitator superfamily (MFS) profile domain-containing protein n=1 Tax=Sporothrix eucalyptigena TaxID=1812306 RepID=A0ABP0CNJ4_9PEZI
MTTTTQEKTVGHGYADESAPEVMPQPNNVEVRAIDIEEKTRGVEHDDAAELFVGEGGVFEYTQEEAKRVLLKLDLILLPVMMISYLLSFIDKAALSNASILGIRTDDHLVGQQYSWVSAIFYFGYLIAQYPSSVLMQKLPIGRYFGVMIVLWGLCSTLTAVTTNFATLAVARFFLGCFETCITPVLTILVGQYWTRREQPLRACVWWMGAPIGGFIIDGLAYSITSPSWGGGKYTQWQVLYLIWGPLTMGWGVLLFFVLPAAPMRAWFLTERERKVAVMRVISNHTGIENRHYRVYQAKECLRDVQAWAFFSLALLQCIVGSGLTNFDKIVLNGLGYDDHQSTKASFGGDGVQFASLLLAGAVTNFFRNARLVTGIVSCTVVLIGSLLVYCLPTSNIHGRQGGLYIMFVNTVTYIMVMSLLSSNIGGFTKKATCAVMVFVGYAVGQIIAPQFFLAKESPTYPTGFRAFFVSTALMIVIQAALLVYLRWENKRRDQLAAALDHEEQADAAAFLDLTDKEQPGFRYIY